jgi:hypothetical protein
VGVFPSLLQSLLNGYYDGIECVLRLAQGSSKSDGGSVMNGFEQTITATWWSCPTHGNRMRRIGSDREHHFATSGYGNWKCEDALFRRRGGCNDETRSYTDKRRDIARRTTRKHQDTVSHRGVATPRDDPFVIRSAVTKEGL